MKLIKEISICSGIYENNIKEIIAKSPKSYKKFKIKKKNGEYRNIFQPSKPTKMLQHLVMMIYLNKFEIHPIAHGFRKNLRSPLRIIGNLHLPFKYSITTDFKDFFYSLKEDDLKYVVNNSKSSLHLDNDDLEMLINLTFFDNNSLQKFLTVGSPASPMISNIIMYEFDCTLNDKVKEQFTNYSLTRYADDIVFSSDTYEDCERYYNMMKAIINSSRFPKLVLNEAKTRYCKPGMNRIINGLSVIYGNKVSVGKMRKKMVKAKLNLLKYDELSEEERIILRGNLAFISDIEPDYINKLYVKYGSDVFLKLNKEY